MLRYSDELHITYRRQSQLTCMGFRERGNSTGLNAAVGIGLISIFKIPKNRVYLIRNALEGTSSKRK